MAFLGGQQLPPEHVGVAERFPLASREGRVVELHALFDVIGLTEIDTMYCDVLAVQKFLLLQDGFIPSFPHGSCPPDAAQQTLLLACPH